ncbi:MAG: SBBP repeat-containing protein [Ignavibacteria bacterium]|nr:SBBP repeat-containing protein [Ignavibacteria bacterium]
MVKNFQRSGKLSEQSREIAVGTSGNVYVTGEYQGSTMDYLTIKYNPLTGDTIWTKKYNGTANLTDYARLLTLDASENIYVTGVTNYTGNGDMATVKYNSSGVQQWVKVYAGSGGYLDDPKDIVADQSGNIYIAIASDYSYAGKYGIIKYNSIGDSLWSRIYDFAVPGFETPYAITLDNGGNVISTGSSGYENESEFGTIKYNSSGVLLWARKFYGSQLVNDVANGMVTDKNGNVYTVGTTRTNYGDNITVIKYNSDGVEKWVHIRGGGGVTGYDVRDEGKAIGIDSSGNVYFTGTWYYWATNKNEICTGKLDSNGTVKWFNVVSGTYTEHGDDIGNDIAVDAAGNSYVTGQLTGPGGDINFITIKYNTLGAEQWSRSYFRCSFRRKGYCKCNCSGSEWKCVCNRHE